MKFLILMTFLVFSILVDEAWSAPSIKKVVCENNGVTVTVDAAKKRSYMTRKKGQRRVSVPMGRVRSTEVFSYDDLRKSVFKLSNKSKIEVSFANRSALGLGYGILTSGKTGKLYDLGDCVRSVN